MAERRAPLTDAEIRRRWQALACHRNQLVRILRAHNIGDAEDYVHDAMLRCVEVDDLDEDRALAFLATTARNLAVDSFRRTGAGARAHARLATRAITEPGPEDEVCGRAEARWLAGKTEALSSREREVLTAKADGLSCEEIADRFQISYKAVESALSRARSRARAALSATFGLVFLPRRRSQVAAGSLTAVGMLVYVTAPFLTLPLPPQPRIVVPRDIRPDANVGRGVAPAPTPGIRSGNGPALRRGGRPLIRGTPTPLPSVSSCMYADVDGNYIGPISTCGPPSEAPSAEPDKLQQCLDNGIYVEVPPAFPPTVRIGCDGTPGPRASPS